MVNSSGPEKYQLKAEQMLHCSCCFTWLTVEETEAGLLTADVLAVRQCWLEERWLLLMCQLVKTVLVCQSVSSSQTEDF